MKVARSVREGAVGVPHTSTKRFLGPSALIMRRYGPGAARPRGVRARTNRRFSNHGIR
jgi:hypothetical protein